MFSISGTMPAPHWSSHGTVLATLVLILLVTPARATPGREHDPDLSDCPNLVAPEGSKLVFHAYAEGVQIYRWDGTAWRFVAPEALLFADARGKGVVGIHYAGPTWEARRGSRVTGRVLERYTPATNAIPWLLLEATSSEGPGIFHRVSFIQRLNTVGGLAPTLPGGFVGAVARVPYTAEYYFYRTRP